MKQAAEPFEALPMPRKDIPQPEAGSYRVYKNFKDYVSVEASSALEALQASKVQSPYKIERESIDYISVLAPSAWGGLEPDAGVINEAAPIAQAEQKETVLIGEPAKDAGAPLSNDDVNKLLNS